jgi:nicotinamide riboside kinase
MRLTFYRWEPTLAILAMERVGKTMMMAKLARKLNVHSSNEL